MKRRVWENKILEKKKKIINRDEKNEKRMKKDKKKEKNKEE